MDFRDAVKALHDGECEGIRRPHYHEGIWIVFEGVQSYNFTDNLCKDFLADDWVLVNEKPKMETVEIVRYYDSLREEYYNSEKFAIARKSDGHEIIKLTGSYQVPAKKKVKRKNIITAQWNGESLPAKWLKEICEIPSGAFITAEWDEEE